MQIAVPMVVPYSELGVLVTEDVVAIYVVAGSFVGNQAIMQLDNG